MSHAIPTCILPVDSVDSGWTAIGHAVVCCKASGSMRGFFFFFLYALHSYTPVVIFPRKDVHKSWINKRETLSNDHSPVPSSLSLAQVAWNPAWSLSAQSWDRPETGTTRDYRGIIVPIGSCRLQKRKVLFFIFSLFFWFSCPLGWIKKGILGLLYIPSCGTPAWRYINET